MDTQLDCPEGRARAAVRDRTDRGVAMSADLWADVGVAPTACPDCGREGCDEHLPASESTRSPSQSSETGDPRKIFQRLSGGGYGLTFLDKDVCIEVRHLRRERHQLYGEVNVF